MGPLTVELLIPPSDLHPRTAARRALVDRFGHRVRFERMVRVSKHEPRYLVRYHYVSETEKS